MIGLGIVSLVVGVLSLLGTRVFTGDVSLFLPLNELAAIDSLKSRHSIYYVLEVIGLGAIPLAVGILVLQFL